MKFSKFFPVAGAVMLFTLSTHAQSFLTNGLVAYYPFNGNANDASGNGNDGTVQGATLTTDRFGETNSAYQFDNFSGGITIPDTILSPTVDGFTFSVWVGTDTNSYAGDYEIIHTGTDNGETFMNINSGQFAFGPLLDTHTGYIVTTPISSNSVTHLVGVYLRGQNVSLYTNGVLANIIPVPDGTLWVWPSYPLSSAIGIYDYVPSPYYAFRGVLDDVRIYNRALSSNEVAKLYTYESTPPNSFLTNGLVAYYPFNGNANDASGNGNNGTVNGASLTQDRLGNANSAYSFNGINNNISFATLPLTQVDDWTMTAWLKPASLNQDGIAVSMGYDTGSFSGGNGYAFGMQGPNGYPFYVTPGNQLFGAFAFIEGFYGGFTFSSTNQWYQVVMMRSAGVTTFYVNGVGTPDGATSTPLTPTAFTIGSENGLRYFNGAIDDVRIYNRAISSNEVSQLFAYESGSSTNPPSITGQPQPVIANAGDNVSFNVTVTGALPLNYQWSLNGTNISGATASSLTISNVSQTDLGAYAVVVSNPFGSTNSSDAMLSMYPFIETPFTGAITDWGKDTTLSLEGWGTGPLHYQWFKDGVALLNATNQTLFLPSIQFTNAGLYSVVLSSPLGSVTNVPAQVVVNPAGVSIGMFPGVYVSGVVGYTYTIQASSDLTNTNGWTTTATLTLLQPVQLWVDINVNALSPTNPHKYYRVVPGG
jgi:hypothetical protein